MRAFSSPSRALIASAILLAAALVLGGAFFAGYIGAVQRALHDPPPVKAKIAEEIAALETVFGYDGFLKAYRNYRLTGEPAARRAMQTSATEGARLLEDLRVLYRGNDHAEAPLREARAVARTFAHIAATAPETNLALRGTPAMDAIATLPQSHQLETAYVSLSNALDRLVAADRGSDLGGVATALSWSQGVLVALVAALVFGLITTAALLQFGFISAEKLWTDGTVDRASDASIRPADASPLRDEIQALRDDIKSLSIRIAEDQILTTGGAHAFAPGDTIRPTRPQRTLADVPDDEVKSRLQNLAAEMVAAQLQIATDLSDIAERAQSKRDDDAQTLRDDVMELGSRSESLLQRLESDARDLPAGVDDANLSEAFDAAAADIVALADTIATLEARTQQISEAAVATRFAELSDTLSPVEHSANGHATEQKTDGALRAVFEAIDRLNNIAAALARAGEAERQRRVAH